MTKYITILSIFCIQFTVSLSAQTINRVDVIQGPTQIIPNRWEGQVVENNGKFYIYRSEPLRGDFIVNDSLIREINFGEDVLGLSTSHSLVPIYEVDKGITDHIPLEFALNIGFHTRDSLIAASGLAKYLLIDQDTIYGDLINGEEYKSEGFLLLADHNLNIKFLERVFPSREHRVLITDDAIYFAYNWSTNVFYPQSIFMGENFDDGDDDPDILLHKIDRKTLTKVWSKRISTHSDDDFIRHFTLDKEDNIVMIIDGAGELYFGDSTVFDYSVVPDDYFDFYKTESYILKVNSNGEVINSLVYYGKGAQIVTDVIFNNSNEMLLMGSLETFGKAYLGDQVFPIDEGNIPGYLMKYDSDWNFQWSKFYDGFVGYVTNALFEGDDIIVSYQSTVSIQDDDEVFDDPKSQGTFHVHKLDEDGNEITKSISGGTEAAIFDMKKIGEDRYLLFIVENSFSDFDYFSFLGYEPINPIGFPKLYVFDVSGDLFESVNAVSEYLDHSEWIVYPNPARSNQDIHISMPGGIHTSEVEIKIQSANGQLEFTSMVRPTNQQILLPANALQPGMKIISLRVGGRVYTAPLVIK